MGVFAVADGLAFSDPLALAPLRSVLLRHGARHGGASGTAPRMRPLTLGRWPTYSPACRRAVDRLLARGGSLTAYRSAPDSPLGPREGSWAWRLERTAERMFSVRHVVACSSGTMALQAALRALDLPAGSEVITSPYTFSATAAAIIHAGLRPVFADVNPDTFCLDGNSVRLVAGRSSVGVGAILPVDLFGRIHNLHDGTPVGVIEDACQAVGANIGRFLWGGVLGDCGVWSFNGLKNVPAGEAGAAVTDNDNLARRVRLFISHGENVGDSAVGLNGRLNELTACVAYFGLLNVHKMNAWRRRLALELSRRLKDEPRVRVLTPKEIEGHALYVYPLIVNEGVDRVAFVRRLHTMGVEAREGYSTPLHRLPAFKDAQRIPLPVVEELEDRRLVLLFQVRPPARRAHMVWLAAAIKTALGKS